MENLKGNVKLFNMVCAALMAVVLILQFVPFWHFVDGETEAAASISGYIWMPDDHKALDKHLESVVEGHSLNDMLLPPILTLVLSAVGLVLCLLKPGQTPMLLLPLGCGLAVLIGCLTIPAMKLGTGWALHLVLGMALLVIAAAGLILNGKSSRA